MNDIEHETLPTGVIVVRRVPKPMKCDGEIARRQRQRERLEERKAREFERVAKLPPEGIAEFTWENATAEKLRTGSRPFRRRVRELGKLSGFELDERARQATGNSVERRDGESDKSMRARIARWTNEHGIPTMGVWANVANITITLPNGEALASLNPGESLTVTTNTGSLLVRV